MSFACLGRIMEQSAQIGASIRIVGEVTAREPLTIAGSVEGSVDVEGHPLTILASAKVNATVQADTIVVAGHVNGLMSASGRIQVRDTATVEGDLSAPSICLTEGATVHGRIETTGGRSAALPLAS
jgi:cytoskeletal protein CcmA (bactofilin family)